VSWGKLPYMFGIRRPRHPLAIAPLVDIELLLRRTVEVVGHPAVRDVEVVTDIKPWGLDQVDGSERMTTAAAHVLRRLPAAVTPCDLAIEPAHQLTRPADYRPAIDGASARIILSDQTVTDSLRTVVELAFQYSHHFWHLVGDGRELDTDPRMTNLLPIACGLGVLVADASLYEKNWTQAGFSGWSVSRAGYYNAAEIGYALALLSRIRHETAPDWIRSLRLDARESYERAQRYFAAQVRFGHRLLFDGETIPSTRCDPRELADWLAGDDAATAYASALALLQMDRLPPTVADAAIIASTRWNPDLTPLATRILGKLRAVNPDVQEHLRVLIVRGKPVVQSAAIQSAHDLRLPLESFLPQMIRLLDKPSIDPLPLIMIIQCHGKTFAPAATKICQLLSRALREDDDQWRDALVQCLRSIVDDPRVPIEKSIRSPKLRREVLELMSLAS